MRTFVLKLDYGTIVTKNLRDVWIEPTMRQCWRLCYKDDRCRNKGKTIYRSPNRRILVEMKAKMLKAYKEGKNEVRL